MIRDPTVLVLGAGASKPYGFPLGGELVQSIVRLATEDWTGGILWKLGISQATYRDFVARLRSSHQGTVDAFLEENPELGQIGRVGIALALLGHENGHQVFSPRPPHDNWYEALFLKLHSPSWERFRSQPIGIISFNYDMSFDRFLVERLSYEYGSEILRSAPAGWNPQSGLVAIVAEKLGMPMIHIHGSLGNVLESYGPPNPEVDHDYIVERIARASESIRIIGHSEDADSDVRQAQSLISNANRVLFLGCGYHSLNMRLLGFGTGAKHGNSQLPRRTLAGTRVGLSAEAWHSVGTAYGIDQTTENGRSPNVALIDQFLCTDGEAA